jgi:hypothetical protein
MFELRGSFSPAALSIELIGINGPGRRLHVHPQACRQSPQRKPVEMPVKQINYELLPAEARPVVIAAWQRGG